MKLAGIDCIRRMQKLVGRLDRLEECVETAPVLEDEKYLLNTLDHELQPPIYQLVDILCTKPGKAN